MLERTLRGLPDTTLFDCLASPRRRATVTVLDDADEWLAEETLATRVAATLSESDPEDVGSDRRRRVRTGLHHAALPKLEQCGVIERDDDAESVSLVDHPALANTSLRRTIETPSDPDTVDALFDALAHRRRQRTVAVLGRLHHAIERREAAALVAADERDCSLQDLSESVVDEVAQSFRHVHIPKLRTAGLVRCDPEDGTVAYDDHPDFTLAWVRPDGRRSPTEASD